jgi:hypothetical protein
MKWRFWPKILGARIKLGNCQSQSQSHIATNGPSVCLSQCQSPSGAHNQIFLLVWKFLSCPYGAPSLTRGQVCHLLGNLCNCFWLIVYCLRLWHHLCYSSVIRMFSDNQLVWQPASLLMLLRELISIASRRRAARLTSCCYQPGCRGPCSLVGPQPYSLANDITEVLSSIARPVLSDPDSPPPRSCTLTELQHPNCT